MVRRSCLPVLAATLLTATLLTACLFGLPAGVAADTGSAPQSEELNSADATATMEFVRKHHPDLVPLLKKLESSKRGEYLAAIQEVDKTRRRLARLEEKQPELYLIQLDTWKVESRIRLLIARLAMREDVASVSPAEREMLAELLRQRRDVKKRILEYQHAQFRERLARIERQIEQNSNADQASIEREVDSVLRQASSERKKISRGRNSKKKSASERVVPLGDASDSPTRNKKSGSRE